MEKTALALEEIKLLQSIIARHDDISFKIKGWCITLNVGIIAALYSNDGAALTNLSKELSFSCLAFITFFFVWLEAIYRVAMNRAIERSAIVEKEIREGRLTQYPQINLALGKKNRIRDQWKTLKNVRVIAPYLIVMIIDTLALLLK